MTPEQMRLKERIDQNNKIVSWIENFKGFLTKIVKEFLGVIVKNKYQVEVQNPTVLPKEFKIARVSEIIDNLQEIQTAIQNKKEFETTDTSNLESKLTEISSLMQKFDIEIPELDDSNIVNELKSLSERFSGLVKAINDIPAPQATDMTKLETMVASMSKSFVAYYDNEMMMKRKHEEEMKKMISKPDMQPTEVPKLVGEGDIRDTDGDVVEMYEKYSDGTIKRDIADIKYKNGKKYIDWRFTENAN